MCGIAAFWNYSILPDELSGQFLSRGPDSQRKLVNSELKLSLFHSLLKISPNSCPQPFVINDVIVLFNGELYNSSCLYGKVSEVDYIANIYLNQGLFGLQRLRGEFSIIIVDTTKKVMYVIRDFFGTKPLFLLHKGTSFSISSVSDTIVELSGVCESAPTLIANNSITTICLKEGNILSSIPLHSLLNIGQNVRDTDVEEWKSLFFKSVQRRVPLVGAPYINLSSGHDSGLIAACLDHLEIPSCFYILPRGEELPILQQRIEYLLSRGHTVKILDLQDNIRTLASELLNLSDHVNVLDHNYQYVDPVRVDPASVGHLITALFARSENKIVGLSGQGSDELYSGYGLFGVPISTSSNIPDRISFNPYHFPWMHAMDGHMKRYLLKDEIIASLTSIETRYPFLDLDLFLALLGLSSSCFNDYYKGPVENLLSSLSFPYSVTRLKRGFNPLSMDRSSHFLEYFSDYVVKIDSEVLSDLSPMSASLSS